MSRFAKNVSSSAVSSPSPWSIPRRTYTSADADFFQYADREIYVGDVRDSPNSDSMGVGFYRNRKKALGSQRTARSATPARW